jgi:hypothetical protein
VPNFDAVSERKFGSTPSRQRGSASIRADDRCIDRPSQNRVPTRPPGGNKRTPRDRKAWKAPNQIVQVPGSFVRDEHDCKKETGK